MKKVFSFLLFLSASRLGFSAEFNRQSSTDSIQTQPFNSEIQPLLGKQKNPSPNYIGSNNFNSTMPRGGTAMNAAALEDLLRETRIVNITYTPRTSTLEGSDHNDRIETIPVRIAEEPRDQHLEIQNGTIRSVCIPFCIVLTCTWVIGATTMGILRLTNHKS